MKKILLFCFFYTIGNLHSQSLSEVLSFAEIQRHKPKHDIASSNQLSIVNSELKTFSFKSHDTLVDIKTDSKVYLSNGVIKRIEILLGTKSYSIEIFPLDEVYVGFIYAGESIYYDLYFVFMPKKKKILVISPIYVEINSWLKGIDNIDLITEVDEFIRPVYSYYFSFGKRYAISKYYLIGDRVFEEVSIQNVFVKDPSIENYNIHSFFHYDIEDTWIGQNHLVFQREINYRMDDSFWFRNHRNTFLHYDFQGSILKKFYIEKNNNQLRYPSNISDVID